MTGTPGRCGRTRRHNEHTWVRRPNDPEQWRCDGKPSPRSALQLVVDQPALLDIAGSAGVVIAEGVRAS
jgi:hypothetical protein